MQERVDRFTGDGTQTRPPPISAASIGDRADHCLYRMPHFYRQFLERKVRSEMNTLSYTKVIDISMPLHNGVRYYPGDIRFRREVSVFTLGDADDVCTTSSLTMSAHSGTHIDAPRHFLASGRTVDGIPPHRFVSNALVLECNGRESAGSDFFRKHPIETGMSLLLKSGTDGGLRPDAGNTSPTISPDGARYLREKRINLAGTDGISIETDGDPTYPVHRHLLEGDIIILENLVLAQVEQGFYTLLVFPLLIRDGDGAPARAVLLA